MKTIAAIFLWMTMVSGIPVITAQPQSVSVAAGSSAKFCVTATNATSYRWQVSGHPIFNASQPCYSIPTVFPAMSGAKYSVVVSNSAGSVTSAQATLTVATAAESQVVLKWKASVTKGVTGYNVYKASTSGGPYSKISSVAGITLTYTDQEKGPATFYYVVTAVLVPGLESAYSTPAVAKVP